MDFLSVSYEAKAQQALGGVFTAKIASNTYAAATDFTVGAVQVLGSTATIGSDASRLRAPTSARINGRIIDAANIEFDATTGSIVFNNLEHPLSSGFVLTWAYI